MKKRVLNIKPQEVTTDGRTSVRYKGSDGKMHSLASSANENGAGEPIAASPATVQEPLIIEFTHNFATNIVETTSEQVLEALLAGRRVVYIGHIANANTHIIINGTYYVTQPEGETVQIKAIGEQGSFGYNMVHAGNNIMFEG